MRSIITTITEPFLQLLFPHLCVGCGYNLPAGNPGLCPGCLLEMAETGFAGLPGNPVEKKFWGRIGIRSATSAFYFRTDSLIQHLMHRFKYKSDQELCLHLGRMLGSSLVSSDRFRADVLVPLPLFPRRERKRGYNQATLLCEGISAITGIPVESRVVRRTMHTETQTSMSRTERWQNMEGHFAVEEPGRLAGKHVLLVDDVVTTGATLEACGQELVKIPGVTLSIATLFYAAQV
ncbi:MAG: ComF family protein, partial [Chitinophagaceae bacterium]